MTKLNTLFKEYSALFVVGSLCTIAFSFFVLSNVQARDSISGNPIMVQEEAATNQLAMMSFPSLSVATSGVLVDASAVTYFQHFASGTIEVSRIEVSCESKGRASTTVKVGVIADMNSDGTAQEVHYFDSFLCVSSNVMADTVSDRIVADYSPSRVRLSLNRATTSGFISDDIELGTNNFPTAQLLRSPAARKIFAADAFAQFRTTAARGDLVVRIVNVSGTATSTIKVFYRVQPTNP